VSASFVPESTRTDIALPLPRKREPGLRVQLLLGLAVVSLFAVFSVGLLSLWAASNDLREVREATAASLSTAAAAAAASVIDPNQELGSAQNLLETDPLLRQVAERSGILEISIISATGVVVASRPPRWKGDIDPPILQSALEGVPPTLHYRDGAEHGDPELLSYAGIATGGRIVGAVRIVMPAPPPILAFIRRSGPVLLGLALGDAILLVGFGYFLLTQMVIRPLRAVEVATAAVTAGNLDQQLLPSGPREIAALAASFNQMTMSLASQREQLIRTEKLASVGQLAAGVAHEIGNPLAAILGYSDILKSDAGEPEKAHLTPADRLDIATRVKAETHRIHRIIQDLLEYSRPSKEEARMTDPLALLRAAESLLRPQARFREVEMVYENASEGWPTIRVSPERLTQVFVNLLLNAADAMEQKGTLRVSSERDDGRVRLVFADEGPGVPRASRRKIFDPFYTTKEPGKGTGLGLSICRSIVETYAGTLELHETPEGEAGARFSMSFPPG